MEKNIFKMLIGREDSSFTRRDIFKLVKIPAITVAILTLPLAITANFVDREKSYWILFFICSTFAVTSFFSGTERNRLLAILFTCAWTVVVIICGATLKSRI